MENEPKYEMLAEGVSGIPSTMGVIPSEAAFQFTESHLYSSLKGSKYFTLISFEKTEDEAYDCLIRYLGEEYNVEMEVLPVSDIGLQEYGYANKIEEKEIEIAMQQPYYLLVNMFFNKDVLTSFHLQLKILDAIVPHASLVIDYMSIQLLSARWLHMTAQSSIPPSPDYLYTIHGVYEGEEDAKRYWLHTHGLLRCGCIELEMLNITDGAQQMSNVVNMVVKKFLTDPSKENEKFTIGYDGLGINLAWVRWEEALKDFPENCLGGKNDRIGEDNVHAEPSGVLFAVEDNNMVSPEIYVKTLSDNPIFYISDEETQRMSALAKERFSFFEDSFHKNAQVVKPKSIFNKLLPKKEEPSWWYIVKLGLQVDNAEVGTDKEHLWFEVISIRDGKIEGKLLNQPYWIAALKEGNTYTYPVELLTDWMIYSPEGYQYTTDSIYQLGYS